MNAISARLDQLEKDSFPSDTQGLLKEVKEYYEEKQKTPAYKDAKNPDDSDPVYRLFKWVICQAAFRICSFCSSNNSIHTHILGIHKIPRLHRMGLYCRNNSCRGGFRFFCLV